MADPHRRSVGRKGHVGDDEARAFVQSIPVRTPQEMAEAIRRRGYIGQERAVRAVSLMGYRHVSRLRKLHLQRVPRERLPVKGNMLFVGPTGCGKTYLVELLFRDLLGLPTAIVDMTGFSETGYVGQDVVSILTRLLYAADLSLVRCSCGVVCLDEFDKIASGQNNAVFAGAGTTKDVSGLGVQRELLKMLESAEVTVPLELSHSEYAQRTLISTADVAFIACGTFSGLKGLIESRDEHIGFDRASSGDQTGRIAVSYDDEEVNLVRNFRDYGFLPELIGRFSRIVPFHALGHADLTSILSGGLLERYRVEFALEGIELEVDSSVLERVVKESLERETGARSLEATLIRYIEDAAFEAYSRPGARRLALAVRDGAIVHAVS
jgi:ATP-dependent Clp protease ATP-binding subunit ClpX